MSSSAPNSTEATRAAADMIREQVTGQTATEDFLSAGPDRFPVRFEWHQSGTTVGLTGSFNNWGSQITLETSDGDEGVTHSVRLYLPPGTHFFKFCIDGAWKYDPEITFAPDEYGNLNNFLTVVSMADDAQEQRPTRTMLRDSEHGLPVMNPTATDELLAVLEKKSPSRTRQVNKRSPPLASLSLENVTEVEVSTPVTPLRSPKEPAGDAEYGLDVDTSEGSQHGARRRSSSGLLRSRSEESLVKKASATNMSTGASSGIPAPSVQTSLSQDKYSNSRASPRASSSVLLAATTQHFGGDLRTQEHSQRAEQGGHRSLMTVPNEGTTATARRSGKLIIFLVGLPGRGKTFIGNILARHLTWMGHQAKVFSTGEYRRQLLGSNVNHEFWNPLNKESQEIRSELAMHCLKDSIAALEQDECDCVVYDATNATQERREMLRQEVQARFKCAVMFIESICDAPELIASSINEMKLHSEDYAAQTMEQAAKDYSKRILQYESVYEPLSSKKEDVPFIKVMDVGRQIFCNQVYGYLQSRIMFLMANLQLRPRPIWLSRHGESMYNTQKRIGGDAPLSPLGIQYAMQLDRFIDAYYPAPDTELAVWTSTMLRTGMTVERIAARGRSVVKWKQLDEIDAGICDGLTYEQVAEDMPEEYVARKNNKLYYRYPRGESYQDVIHRLEPVITELMRMDQPVLIIAHQAILRVLYAYLTNKSPAECPTINIPLHKVIQLTPKAYQCEEVWHSPM